MKKLLIIFLSLGIFACSQNTVKEEETQQEPVKKVETVQKTENPHQQQMTNPHANKPAAPEKKIIIPKEVSSKFKSVIIEVGYKTTNKTVDTDVLIGQKAEVAGTPLVIEVEAYLPDFTMDQNSTMTSKSAKENNPAAKIKVYKADKLVFDGWLFKNFPDVHPFEDPEYKLSLKSSVLK
jgi:hypothetical protein